MMDKRDIRKYGLPTAPPPYDDIVDWGRMEYEANDPSGWDWLWRRFAKVFYNWQSAQTATMEDVVAEYDRVCEITPRPAPTEHTRRRLEPLVEDMRAELTALHTEPEGGFSIEARELAQAIIDMGGTEEQALRAAHEWHNWQPARPVSREELDMDEWND